jgi:hypothetical protein
VNFYIQFILIPCLDCYVENEIITSVEEKLLHARTNTHTSMSTLIFFGTSQYRKVYGKVKTVHPITCHESRVDSSVSL